MDDWLVLGLAAALAYGLSAFFSKLAMSTDHLGVSPHIGGLFTGLGVASVFIIYYLFIAGFKVPTTTLGGALAAYLVGFLWALGLVFVYFALLKNADISKMAPIYNMNTLLVVLLGIVVLRELPNPSNAVKVFLGALLIILGGILVSG